MIKMLFDINVTSQKKKKTNKQTYLSLLKVGSATKANNRQTIEAYSSRVECFIKFDDYTI